MQTASPNGQHVEKAYSKFTRMPVIECHCDILVRLRIRRNPCRQPRRSWWQVPFSEHLNTLRHRESQVFLTLSMVIGAITGLVVVAFIVLTERLGMRLYPVHGTPWRRLLFPVVGSLGIGYLLYRFFPNARGSGVPQTKAALFARDGRITLRTVLGKFFCTSVTLASGIPLGREGPSVQVGAGIGSVLGRALGLSKDQVKNLIPVGAAAAIAAAFNTPLAAVVFALEEIMGDLNAPMMGGVVLASATAWVVLRLSLGDHPLFNVPRYHLVSPRSLPSMRCWAWPAESSPRPSRSCCSACGPLPTVPEENGLVSAGGRRVDGRPNGLVCAPGNGCRLRFCRRRLERRHGLSPDASALC